MAVKSQIYTVSQINSLIKTVLANSLPPKITVKGEITDLRNHHSGHLYFSLKDKAACLPCTMWKGKAAKLKFNPENGLDVLITGFIDVYVPHGKYQFMAESIEPAGLGALQLAFEQTVARLEADGLFDDRHKKPLPKYPDRICILTSESGAAVHDISDSIWNRWPCVKLFLYPVPVQGSGAAESIAAAIADINSRKDQLGIDLMIVGRGGGSLEDLWQFNQESLARAIFASDIPIISAVGHEIDTTVADLVADKRASTPTKAGAIAVPDKTELLGQLESCLRQLEAKARTNLRLAMEKVERYAASSVVSNPRFSVVMAGQRVDELSGRLRESENRLIERSRNRISGLHEKVLRIEPHQLLGRKRVQLGELENRTAGAVKQKLNQGFMDLTARENRLKGLDPKSVLRRGYSITTDPETGKVITGSENLKAGKVILTEFAGQKRIRSKITDEQELF